MAKLTVNVEPNLISKIKTVAKKRNLSVSKMIERFFEGEIEAEKEPFRMKSEDELSDFVRGISISGDPVPDFDHKTEYHKHLEEKYGL